VAQLGPDKKGEVRLKVAASRLVETREINDIVTWGTAKEEKAWGERLFWSRIGSQEGKWSPGRAHRFENAAKNLWITERVRSGEETNFKKMEKGQGFKKHQEPLNKPLKSFRGKEIYRGLKADGFQIGTRWGICLNGRA